MRPMKIAIVGYGLEGKSAANFFDRPENQITVCDQDTKTIVGEKFISRLGNDYLQDLSKYDLIIRSPGVSLQKIVEANPGIDPSRISSGTNEFFKLSPSRNIIGVTGTKGKGTTSTLIYKMLLEAGKRTHLAGNIGVPALELLKNGLGKNEYVVLEMSSFQLSDCRYSPHIAVCLTVSQDHLDWHGTLEDYYEAKRNIFSYQSKSDVAIYFVKSEVSRKLADSSQGRKLPYYESPGAHIVDKQFVIDNEKVISVDSVGLIGEHNWENICAAITCVWQITKDKDAIARAIRNFSGLEHRIEFVKEIDGIKFYNDSFASAPDATIAALKSILSPKVIIIGGFDRMLNLDSLVNSLVNENKNGGIRKVLIIGQSSQRLRDEFNLKKLLNYQILDSKDINEIVETAYKLAKTGDSVLLSPGFASFDMFKNFEERGKEYKKAIEKL
jgi:UDP-N-acetylmuramoylalanine--D-glutamate ligase